MKRSPHRQQADVERAAAAATNLPNVRERHLRSAEAHDAAADMEDKIAMGNKERIEEAIARRSTANE